MNKVLKIVLITIGIGVLILCLWYFKSIVAHILVASVLSLIGQPLVNLICKIRIGKYHPPRALGAGITLLFLWAVIFSFFSIFIPLIITEANNLSTIDVSEVIRKFGEPIERFAHYFGHGELTTGKDFSIEDYASDKILRFFSVNHLTNFLKGSAGTLGDIFIAIFSISFVSFFFLKDQTLFGNAILMFVPVKYKEEVSRILSSVNHLLKRYFVGIFIEVLSVGILVGIGLSIVGLKFSHVIILASFAGLINVIPYIGPIIGTAFGLMMGVAIHLGMDFYTEMLPRLGLMALVFVIVQVVDNVLFQPLIYSSSVNAHPLEIFLVILIAGNLAGITGMVLAIPSYTILRVIAKEFFANIEVVKKLTQNL